MSTPFKDRCGDCKFFVESGVKCDSDTRKRNRIYYLDYKCEASETPS